MEIKRDSNAFSQFEKHYWAYYRELENDFLSLRKYISICKDNFSTFSIEILKLYQAACSEIDVVGKAMASMHNPDFKPDDKKNTIYKWWYEIQDSFMLTEPPFTPINARSFPIQIGLCDYKCTLLNEESLQPWIGFSVALDKTKNGKTIHKLTKNSKVPSWWSDYNSVKHTRTSLTTDGNGKINYTKANLGNLCNAMAALYTLEKSVMDSIGTRDDFDRFMDYSLLFVKETRYTWAEMDQLFKLNFKNTTEKAYTG